MASLMDACCVFETWQKNDKKDSDAICPVSSALFTFMSLVDVLTLLCSPEFTKESVTF